jgi:hypothetical protein
MPICYRRVIAAGVDRVLPEVVCDHCGEAITDAGEGMAWFLTAVRRPGTREWADVPFPVVAEFTHKDCGWAFEGIRGVRWRRRHAPRRRWR